MQLRRRRDRITANRRGLEGQVRDLLHEQRESDARPARSGSAQHHDLCFGCGNANVFGLQLEFEPGDREGDVGTGRFFVKQDHQGPTGEAHPGIVAAALTEAMALCAGTTGAPKQLELELYAGPPVGTYVDLAAHVEHRTPGALYAVAHASGEDGRVAYARALFAA